MSKRKPHDLKFEFKAIECVKMIKRSSQQHCPLFKRKRVLVVLCSHLKFFSNKGCPNRLVHVVLSNDVFLFEIAQQSVSSHFPIIISCT